MKQVEALRTAIKPDVNLLHSKFHIFSFQPLKLPINFTGQKYFMEYLPNF